MGKESNQKPNYDILAFITTDKDKLLGGKQLSLLAKNCQEAEELTVDIAKSLKAEVVKMKSGDYLVIRA
ncbi:capping complex subunit for YIEGIA [Pseudoneobacillus sp. C159]